MSRYSKTNDVLGGDRRRAPCISALCMLGGVVCKEIGS